jgi:DNA-binding transcriptional regulator YdaS (Cro superfamily)
MQHVIDHLGGPAAVARLVNCKPPSVIGWRHRSIPADRCPALERASAGKYPCEQLRPDVRWHRVPDADWPWHPGGRPLIDVARQSDAAEQEAQRAA